MTSRTIGTDSKKNSVKPKVWWIKLGGGFILSNLFFFLLFSGNESPAAATDTPKGWVEIHVKAELLTPFQMGKKILLVHRTSRTSLESMLKNFPPEPEGHFTVLVKESEAHFLLEHERWEILPFLKTLSFAPIIRGESHEIHY